MLKNRAPTSLVTHLDHMGFGRNTTAQVTPRGRKVLQTGEKIFNALRIQWAEKIGVDKLQLVETVLADRLRELPNGLIDPGWIADEPTDGR
jgi:hypothetical protein